MVGESRPYLPAVNPRSIHPSAPRGRPRPLGRALLPGLLAATCGLSGAGCLTIDPGDDFVPPDVQLSDDVYFCAVQPQVVSALRCASGGPGEAGACHAARSALRLRVDAETDPPPTCENGIPVTTVPPSYVDNLERVRVTVSSDRFANALFPAGQYLVLGIVDFGAPELLGAQANLPVPPLNLVVFDTNSPEAELVLDWIASGVR